LCAKTVAVPFEFGETKSRGSVHYEVISVPPALTENHSWADKTKKAIESGIGDHGDTQAISVVDQPKTSVQATDRIRISRRAADSKRASKAVGLCVSHSVLRDDYIHVHGFAGGVTSVDL
jgi:hypothetical protein